MGQPVVHFEVIGKDPEKLQGFYSDLFGWEIDANNPMNYGILQREGNMTDDGMGIGGGVGPAQEGNDGWVTFYVATDDIEASLQGREPRWHAGDGADAGSRGSGDRPLQRPRRTPDRRRQARPRANGAPFRCAAAA